MGISLGMFFTIVTVNWACGRSPEIYSATAERQDNRRNTVFAQTYCNKRHETRTSRNELMNTGYEIWVCGYDIETRQHSSQWKSNQPQGRKERDRIDLYEGHAGCFLPLPKLYAFEFIPRGSTVNQEFYLTVFGRLGEAKEATGRLAATQLVSAPLVSRTRRSPAKIFSHKTKRKVVKHPPCSPAGLSLFPNL
jgi:hypothetical protein